MKKILMMLSLPLLAAGQQKGIAFEKFLSWGQVLAKARAEHKYIFVDCYATWCGPCKMMDQNVYTDPAVGTAFSKDFVSFKIQLDRTGVDNPEVKAHYADASVIEKAYGIKAYPSFLFLDPDGQLVHRSVGYQPSERFIQLASAARDPKAQYYTLLKQYRQGTLDSAAIPNLALQARSQGDDALASEIAGEYIEKLLSTNQLVLYQAEHIRFIATFTANPNDKAFAWFAAQGQKIDGIMQQRNYSRDIMDNAISNEKADSATIARKYGAETADRLQTKARIYQSYGNNWPVFTAALVHYTDTYENTDDGELMNKNAGFVLQYSNRKSELLSALGWIEHSLKAEPANAAYLKTRQGLETKLRK